MPELKWTPAVWLLSPYHYVLPTASDLLKIKGQRNVLNDITGLHSANSRMENFTNDSCSSISNCQDPDHFSELCLQNNAERRGNTFLKDKEQACLPLTIKNSGFPKFNVPFLEHIQWICSCPPAPPLHLNGTRGERNHPKHKCSRSLLCCD